MGITLVTRNTVEREVHFLDTNRYSDNTPLVKVPNFPALLDEKWDAVEVHITRPEDFHPAMMLAKSLTANRERVTSVELFIPYFPGARQDRRNPTGDVAFAADYYASIVQYVDADWVTIYDPHSDVVPALIDFTKIVSVADIAKFDEANAGHLHHRIYSGVIAPDSGAHRRANLMAETLGVPKVYQAWKNRDVATGKLTGFGIEPIEPGHYLIVDDICDGGGTFNGLAASLPAGVTCDLYVTHGLFSQGLRELIKNFEQIITTDSLDKYVSHPQLKTINIHEWSIRP